jgi:hypothetical protein
MPTASAQITANVGGLALAGTLRRVATGNISHEIVIDAGYAGQTEGMNSAGNAGTIDSISSGNTLGAADLVAIFEDAAETDGTLTCRYNVTVDTDSGISFTFDNTPAASGDTLPVIDNEDVVVTNLPDTIDTDFSGDNILAMALVCDKNCIAQFQDNADTELATFVLKANEPYIWFKDQGITNPLASASVGKIVVGNGSVTAGTFKVGLLVDSEV